MMPPLVVSNDFYASKFLMSDLDQSDYEVVFESQLKSRVLNKSIARLMALIPNSANEQRDVVIFAIEDIVFLEQIRRRIGTPKVWLWNPICSMTKKNRLLFLLYVKLKKLQVWTFDRDDSEKYGFKHFEQVHSEKIIDEDNIQGSGAFFSGVDKGRLHRIIEIRNELHGQGIETYFHIVADKGKQYSEQDFLCLTKSYIGFDQYLDCLKKAEILVDVNQANQSGITLRVIEAFFLNKKLITTNAHVRNAAFYRPENIYIFGHENRPLTEFLREPLKELSIEMKKLYTTKALIDAMIQ